MVNGQWWMVNSIETIKQIISENLGQELADEIDKYMPEHSDEEYNDLVIENIELEDKVGN